MDTTPNGKFPPTETPEADRVWVFGKKVKGWYVARWKWNETDAQRWASQGYEVRRSTDLPDRQMTIGEKYGTVEIK